MAKKSSVSFQHERPRRVKNENIMLNTKLKNQLNKLKRRKVDLSDEDAPEITNWSHAVRGKFYRPIKKQITIRLDADVLEWFKHHSGKYQSLINTACREYVERHVSDSK
jgi:uncharacterized protein (DUF4415 family)